MKIIVKKHGEIPAIVERDEITLNDMQEMVGGLIECIHVGGKVDMWCNDMGKLLEMPINIVLGSESGDILDTIHGDIFFAGHNDVGDTIGLSDGEATWIMNKLDGDGLALTENLEVLPIWIYDPTVS